MNTGSGRVVRWTVSVLTVACLMSTDAFAEQKHPFLICKRDQFPELRRRAKREPWKSMGEQAIKISNSGYSPREGRMLGEQLGLYVGACALAYIVDSGNKKQHAESVRECIERHLPNAFNVGGNGWLKTVPPMCGAFNCIIALDVVHNDLTPAQIKACETVIEQQTKKIGRDSRSWPKARLGTHGTWDIYKGVRTTPDDRYYKFLVEEMTEDGVATRSPGYSFARIVGTPDRVQKAAYMDVLEFTGIDRRYYKDERIRGYFRWIFSNGYNPAGFLHLFGDMHPKAVPGIHGVAGHLLPWRVGRFGREAAGYVAWAVGDKKPPGHILPYVLMKEPLPKPLAPQSQLYMKGGAFFRDRTTPAPTSTPKNTRNSGRPAWRRKRARQPRNAWVGNPNPGLGGALYNITSGVGYHTHQEVNALALCAYGNNLLVNGGWLAPSTRPANRNNTLAINGAGHRKMTGAGLEEGLVGGEIEYACGLSGPALGDDAFARSLLRQGRRIFRDHR